MYEARYETPRLTNLERLYTTALTCYDVGSSAFAGRSSNILEGAWTTFWHVPAHHVLRGWIGRVARRWYP
jgi:hypothetical protein